MKNLKIWNIASRISMVYGVVIALGLMGYFLIMYLIGLIHITELRLLNLFIMMAGVYFAIKQFRRTHRGHIDYFHAFTTGMAAVAIGTVIFSVFIFLFLSVDKNLMQIISKNAPLGFYLDPYIAAYAILAEGTFTGLFVTFLLSNFLATRNPIPRVEGNSEVIQ